MLRFAFLLLAAVLLVRPAAAADPLRVILDWYVNPDHAPLIIAREKGFFAAQDLDVEIIAPSDPNDPPKLVAAGSADIGVSYQPQLHFQAQEGLPLVRIGTLIGTPLNVLLVAADGPVQQIADLKGRKVGFSVGGVEEAIVGELLRRHGLQLSDVEMINVNFSLTPALVAGQVDAVIGAFRNFELTQMELAGRKGRAFFIEDEGIPPYDELIYVANKADIDDPRLRRFLAAVELATFWILNHPDEAWDVFRATDKSLDDELNRRAWYDTLRRFSHSPAALDTGRYARFAAFLEAQGLIKDPPPVSSYAVDLNAGG